MNPWKWQLVWHCANGTSFFVGAAILLVAVFLSSILKIKCRNLITYPLVLIAAVEIFLSATPLASWFYILWGAAVIGWLIVCNCPSMRKTGIFLQVALAFLCCAAIIIEIPYHVMPEIPKGKSRILYVIGDSVSEGIGGVNEHPWPQILGQIHHLTVINLAKSGAKVTDAIRQAKQVHDQNSVVFIEIGGNDLFAPTPPKEFKASLEQILSAVTNSTRTVIMLELPLLPLQNEYGIIQRMFQP